MRIITLALLLLATNLVVAQDKFEFWVWAGDNAEKDPLTKQVSDHEACDGKIIKLVTDKIPVNNPSFRPEIVYELSKDGKILNKWHMPINYNVYAVEGSNIIAGHGYLKHLLKINLDGGLSRNNKIKYNSDYVSCPVMAFEKSDYGSCFVFHDLLTNKERVISYQMPCT